MSKEFEPLPANLRRTTRLTSSTSTKGIGSAGATLEDIRDIDFTELRSSVIKEQERNGTRTDLDEEDDDGSETNDNPEQEDENGSEKEDNDDHTNSDNDNDDNVVLQRKRGLEIRTALPVGSSKKRRTIPTDGLIDFVKKMRCVQLRSLLCYLLCCCLLFQVVVSLVFLCVVLLLSVVFCC